LAGRNGFAITPGFLAWKKGFRFLGKKEAENRDIPYIAVLGNPLHRIDAEPEKGDGTIKAE